MTKWPEVAVVGAGAVGSYFGGMLARAGAPVTLIGRPGKLSPHLEAIERDGLWIDKAGRRERVQVRVATRTEAVGEADLVLFSVKTVGTEEAARQIAPHLRAGALVVSLQNGVDNVDRMREAGIEALAAVVFVGAAVEVPGEVKHKGRGDLVIGGAGRREDAERVAAWFERARVPCPVSDDIDRELWLKLIINSMANAISALTGSTYGQMARHEPSWQVAVEIAREAVAVANGSGIRLDEEEVIRTAEGTARAVGEATASTEQDLARGRRTEIDALNGYIARRGAELGIPTPVNHAMFALVKLAEQVATRQEPTREPS